MRRDIVAYVVEEVFTDLTVTIDQQFAVVAFGQVVLGYPLIRQGIVIVADMYVFWVCHPLKMLKTVRRYKIISEKPYICMMYNL